MRRATRLPTALRTPHHKFLSTLSLRRATPAEHHANSQQEFLSTLSLRRATTVQIVIVVVDALFLSTLSLRRATKSRSERINRNIAFLSTLSLRRATGYAQYCIRARGISIHALLAESDQSPPSITPTASRNFYPRSPCGERLTLIWDVIAVMTISIHALLAESD